MKLVFKKENGVVNVINVNEEVISKLTEGSNDLCFDCKHSACDCPKMAYGEKKNISEYPFITDGCQVYGDNGELLNFVIRACSNFEKETREMTRAEMELIRARIMEGLKTERFDTETVEEANEVQRYQVERGLLVKSNLDVRNSK